MGVVESVAKGVSWVFGRVRDVIHTLSNWLTIFIEPRVSCWLGSRSYTINSANNPHYFAKTAACKKEKEEINSEYQRNRGLLSPNDKNKFDNLSV